MAGKEKEKKTTNERYHHYPITIPLSVALQPKRQINNKTKKKKKTGWFEKE